MEPVYKQALLLPLRFGGDPDTLIDTSIRNLTWRLVGDYPYRGFEMPKYFLCETAHAACGDPQKCRTPSFIGDHIPEAIEEWMRTYADILSIGMIMERAKTDNCI